MMTDDGFSSANKFQKYAQFGNTLKQWLILVDLLDDMKNIGLLLLLQNMRWCRSTKKQKDKHILVILA